MYCSYWTWTQSGACYFLNALALAEGTTVEWGRIGAGPRTLLKAPPASAVTHWPLSPGRPASIHWKAREKVYDSIGKPPWSFQRYLWLCVMLPPTGVTSDSWEEHEKQHWTDTNPCLQRTECTACQKSLYKSKKCWRWMTNTIWWLLGLAGDLPSPDSRPDPGLRCVYGQNPCGFREHPQLCQPEACALTAAPFSKGRCPALQLILGCNHHLYMLRDPCVSITNW